MSRCDPPVLIPQNRATDIFTVAVGIPLLVLSALATARGSRRGRILWLGALGFLLYDYGMYSLGVRWQPLFLAYLLLFALSLYAVIIGLVRTDPALINPGPNARIPRKSVAAYLIGVAVVVGAVWLGDEVPATLTEEPHPVWSSSKPRPTSCMSSISGLCCRPW